MLCGTWQFLSPCAFWNSVPIIGFIHLFIHLFNKYLFVQHMLQSRHSVSHVYPIMNTTDKTSALIFLMPCFKLRTTFFQHPSIITAWPCLPLMPYQTSVVAKLRARDACPGEPSCCASASTNPCPFQYQTECKYALCIKSPHCSNADR